MPLDGMKLVSKLADPHLPQLARLLGVAALSHSTQTEEEKAKQVMGRSGRP
jgi:hypothetical protein